MLATSVTATVYGTDSEGEFVKGVHKAANGAGNAASPLIKRLFVESAAASSNFKDQPITNVPRKRSKALPSDADKERILDLYLDRFGVNDDFTRRRLQQTLMRDLGRLHLVPAHIEEFVKAGRSII